MKLLSKKARGFTLIEILVVIGIIAILAAIVIVAINPAKQFAQARNTTREASVNTVLNAIGQRTADNKGVFDGSLGGVTCPVIPVSATSSAPNIGTGGLDLTCLTPTYIPTGLPLDPTGGTTANTQYTASADAVGRITICAPNHAETAVPGSQAYCLTR